MTGRAVHPNVDLTKILAGAQLPALPQSAMRLLELSRQPTNGPNEFATPIEADPGLAGQVLRFINSSYFGFAREISSVKLGIMLVGTRTIKNFALWNAVFSLVPNPKCGPFDLKSLWQDSLRRALFARAMAKLQKLAEVEEVFTAALLQDIAVPLLAKELPDIYVRLLEARNQGVNRLSALEYRVFGWTHAEAAGLLVRQWNLPEEFAVLIESHADVDVRATGKESPPIRRIVVLSAMLPSSVDPHWIECRALEERYESLVPSGRPSLLEMLEQVDGEYAGFAPILNVMAPRKLLSESYQEATATAR